MAVSFGANFCLRTLDDLYACSTHAAEVGLVTSPDDAVWEYAKANGFVVVSADSDFYDRATALGPPPKVVWLRDWRYCTREVESLSGGTI